MQEYQNAGIPGSVCNPLLSGVWIVVKLGFAFAGVIVVLAYVVACAAAPAFFLSWSVGWNLEGREDEFVAMVVMGNVTGIAGIASVGAVVQMFEKDR